MHQRLLLPAATVMCAVLLVGCDDTVPPSAPLPVSQAIVVGGERVVTMLDGCDPETFAAANITCIRQGGVTIERFLDLLDRHQTFGAWRFSPGTLTARSGQTLLVRNQGGEVHTFTRVEAFGGGIIDLLNALSGNPIPAPECGNLGPDDFIAPGADASALVNQSGTAHYQCCIHPWMRLDIRTRS